MNELTERNVKEQVEKARFEERATSITRIVIVGLAIAGGITHRRFYGILFLIGLVIHFMRMLMDHDRPGKREQVLLIWLEILFVIVAAFVLGNIFIGKD